LIHEDTEVLRQMGLGERMQGSLLQPMQYETDCLGYMDPLMPNFSEEDGQRIAPTCFSMNNIMSYQHFPPAQQPNN
jgi:hypothetical protein